MKRMTTEWLACIARGGALLKSPETARMAAEILRLRSRVTELESQLATARADERERCLSAAGNAILNEVVNEPRHTKGERTGGRMSVIVIDKAIRALPAAREPS